MSETTAVTDTAPPPPNTLDLLPLPSECGKEERERAVEFYIRQGHKKLGEFLRNTQVRIYKEFYGDPKNTLVGDKLHNLYVMREIIKEAQKRETASRQNRTQHVS